MICEGYHVAVMLKEAVDGLEIRPNGTYVDVTFGGAGHSSEILSRLSDNGHLYSFDQDEDAQQNIAKLPIKGDNFTFVHSNFRFLKNWMRYHGVSKVDGILADLGVSSHHFDEGERGFSLRFDGPLDMRMNRSAGRTAADILAEYDEQQLINIFRLYGEVKNPPRIARTILRERAVEPITTTLRLVEVLKGVDKKELTRIFQALRIEVNGEMQALEQMLRGAMEVLAPGGRLVVLTYHSLEDRIVKNMVRAGNINGNVEKDLYGNVLAPMKALGKAMPPSAEEQASNPRSRSAKLRIAVKK